MDDENLYYQRYTSREYQADGDDMYPHASNYYHHHHPGAGPISPTLGGYSNMPPARLQHNPPCDMNSLHDGIAVSGWSQSWQQESDVLSTGSSTSFNFSPILHKEEHHCFQYPQQPLHHNQPHPPHQQGMPPLLNKNALTCTTDPVQGHGVEELEQVSCVPVSTPSSQQLLHLPSIQGDTNTLPSCCTSQSQQQYGLNTLSCSEPQQLPIQESPPRHTWSAVNQSVPECVKSPISSCQSESSAASIESTGDGVFSLTNSSMALTQQPEEQSGSVYAPSRDIFPGDYGFNVFFRDPGTSAYSYSPESKVLCVNKGVDFAAIFSFSERPQSDFTVRTLVCCKTDQDIQKIGTVRRCATHVHKDSGSNHFLTCRNDKSLYSEYHSHSIITVPLDSMAEYDLGGPTCVYSCACYSTCVVGKGANRPTLVIIFSLVDNVNGSVVGQDVVNLRCCACPNRDSGKSRKRGSNTRRGNLVKKRKKNRKKGRVLSPESPQTAGATASSPSFPELPPLSSLPTQFNLSKDVQPDEEGYYNFTWRLKDKDIFNMLTIFKAGHSKAKAKDNSL